MVGNINQRVPSRVSAAWSIAAHVVFWIAVLCWLPAALFLSTLWGWGQDLSGQLGVRVFLSVGLLFVPALAIVGYAADEGPLRFAKAAALVVLGAVGLALAARVATWLYPEYPRRGPHELIAAATVLPALIIPLAAIAKWKVVRRGPRTWIYCAAWGAIVLTWTIFGFKRDVEMSLPLSATVSRWEHSDIQDYSEYYIRADHVDAADAARYAEALGLAKYNGPFACTPTTHAWNGVTADWKPSQRAQVWMVDDRTLQDDKIQYPTGLAGCVTRVAWADNSLYLCDICDWGI